MVAFGCVLLLPSPSWAQKVPPGFKVELLFQAPQIEHPSVVTCDDQGNLFIGEDPMDMRGPSTKPIDRILFCRFDQSGKVVRKTVFCDKLSAVFGMLWHEGALYVMHAPYFSLFKDTDGDGVADVRKDLIVTMGHPAGKFGLNNHQPTGLQLGIDGLVYVSLGDKGIPKAVGADGSTITLEGGGIVRLRPDGTRLEVVSTGIRNHLDLALDGFDNIFAYENDDDIGWPVQLFHHIPTGYFGYPYYRQTRPGPRLPPISVVGDGTPCGAACYGETAWPARYRGRVFFGEWGKGKIECVNFQKKGASFTAQVEDFFIGDLAGDFRPIDLCFSSDGKHMYVADWNFAAGGKPAKVGRVFRVTYVGRDVPPEPPRAADNGSLSGLLRSLDHPARQERMQAQQKLAVLGETAADPVAKLLAADTGTLGKIHAIWTLKAIADRTPGYEPANHWLAALKDVDAEVRAQAARALGYRRVVAATNHLVRSLQDGHPAVRLQAAIALGRIGQKASVVPLLHALEEKDPHARFAMIQALRAINHWEPVWPLLVKARPPVRQAIVATLGGVYDLAALKVLDQWLQQAPEVNERVAALQALEEVYLQAEPYTGGWWGPKPAASGNPGRPKKNSWAGSGLVAQAVALALKQPSLEVQLAAVQAQRRVAVPESLPRLRQLAKACPHEPLRREAIVTLAVRKDSACVSLLLDLAGDPHTPDPVRQEAIKAAIAIRSPQVASRLIPLAGAKEASVGLLVTCLNGLAALQVTSAADTVAARLHDPRVEVRLEAVRAYGKICGPAAVTRLVAKLNDTDLSVRRAALETLGRIGSPQAVPAMVTAAAGADVRFDALLALAAIPDVRALALYLDGLQHPSQQIRAACRKSLTTLGEAAGPDLRALHQRQELPLAARRELQTIFAAKKAAWPFLFTIPLAKLDPVKFADFANHHHGDAARGQKLFADLKGIGCIKCHAVSGQGGNIGPDLGGVGARYPRAELIRSVLEPSNRIVDGYELTIVVTTSGALHQGIVKSQTSDKVVLLTPEGESREIRAGDIEEQRRSNLSPMPTGLTEGMTLRDFADIIAYLESLKEKGPARPRLLEK